MSIEKLNRFINNENQIEYIYYTLDNVKKILAYLGNPHEKIKTIHIAGTNGKGSTAFMLNNIFIKSGYKTGLFTSPHLLKINERIKISNTDISDIELNEYIDNILETIEKNRLAPPTYFDIITSLAFKYFYDNNVDVAIIEVGLGGRKDSTNVVNPLCSVITDISIDHTAVLGKDINDIAYEKGGIIKKNVPVITSNFDNDIVKILENIAGEFDTKIYRLGSEFLTDNIREKNGSLMFDFSIHNNYSIIKIDNVKINSIAEFQIKNASLAITVSLLVKEYYKNITENTIRNSIKKTIVPGRFQVLKKHPHVIFDPAHNSSALYSILELLKKKYSGKKIYIIISIMKDKDYSNILENIGNIDASIIYYILNDERCYRPLNKELEKINFIINNELTLQSLLGSLEDKNTLFFFTGSFRLYEIATNYIKTIN